MPNTIAEASLPDTEKLDTLFNAQKAAMVDEPYPTLQTRLERLASLKKMLLDNRERFHASVAADFGTHSPILVDMMETGPVIARVTHVEANLEQWLSVKTVDLGAAHGSSVGEIHRLPKGVMGNIAPWNFPVESSLVMCTDMLAAGNRVIIKPSELSPHTAQLIEELVSQYFAPEVLAVTQGDASFGHAFAGKPWDHLTFTGSSRVGQLVLAQAAKNLVPVTLELGGKNPVVFAADGVNEQQVARFMAFKNLKSGQVCTSPDYAYVPADQLDEWVSILKKLWQTAYPKFVGHADATGIINDNHFKRLTDYIEQAEQQGVQVISLGEESPDANRRHIPMTLLVNPLQQDCMSEEIFGPLIPVLTYESMDEVFDAINTGPTPLASYLVSKNDELIDRFIHQVQSGGTAINNFGLQGGHVALPFGGLGASGMGCHSGYEGFLNYSHSKSVFYGSDDSPVHNALLPPIHPG